MLQRLFWEASVVVRNKTTRNLLVIPVPNKLVFSEIEELLFTLIHETL